MNKSELLNKIKEKNKELESLNFELTEILKREYPKNLGKCFKQDLCFGAYAYYKIIQILDNNYKVLRVCGDEISTEYWSTLKDFETYLCSTEEFDALYDKVINNALANKVIY